MAPGGGTGCWDGKILADLLVFQQPNALGGFPDVLPYVAFCSMLNNTPR